MQIVANSEAGEKLTVAIVHYNTPDLTARCLSSALAVLRAGAPGAFRIVVVDNRSANPHFEALRDAIDALDAPEVLLVRSCINGGFGLGCMTALNYSPAVTSRSSMPTRCLTATASRR